MEPILPVIMADVDGFGGPFSRNVEVMEDMGPPVDGGTTMAGVDEQQSPERAG